MRAYEKYFDDSYVPPNNLIEFFPCDFPQSVFVGGSCTNVFKTCARIDEGDVVDVIYVQQDKTSLTKRGEFLKYEFPFSCVKVELSEGETALFDDRLLDCTAQVRITRANGRIEFGLCERVYVLRTLS